MNQYKRYSLNKGIFGRLTYVKENPDGDLCTIEELNANKRKQEFIEKQRDVCIRHINKIDDVLEYSLNDCTKKRMKEEIMNIINDMTQELGSLQKENINSDNSSSASIYNLSDNNGDIRFETKEVK